MGLFDTIRGQFIDVIEWLDPSQDTMVYRFERQGHVRSCVAIGYRIDVQCVHDCLVRHEGISKCHNNGAKAVGG